MNKSILPVSNPKPKPIYPFPSFKPKLLPPPKGVIPPSSNPKPKPIYPEYLILRKLKGGNN